MSDISDAQLIRYLGFLGITLPDHEVLMPGEVAELFRVDSRTVRRWGAEGLLTFLPTPGGHGRYSRLQVVRLLKETLGPLIKEYAYEEVAIP